MIRFKHLVILVLSAAVMASSCNRAKTSAPPAPASRNVRPLRDTLGFARYSWQMDSLIARMERRDLTYTYSQPFKFAVCPHDDYTYVGVLYPQLLQHVRADNLFLIGVAHKAAAMHVEDSLVFESFTHWKGPWGDVAVSPVRSAILEMLKGKFATVNDSLHISEHSVEALIPYLQFFNRNISIIPILVPAMSPDRMEQCGKALADAIGRVARQNSWRWGRDYAIVVTTDAVHYGNEEWGGKDYALFGCDEEGNIKAVRHEIEIIDSCFTGDITAKKIRLFNDYTLNPGNYREYRWTWCGRYCVPVAMYAAYYLSEPRPLHGRLVGYNTSITYLHVPVDDLGMGRTAVARNCHWVGYAALGYR